MASAKMTSADNATDSPGEKVTANKMDSLALVIEQVSHAQRVARQTPVASSRDETDSIFLCGFASQDSFVGSLEVEEGMTDEAIEDFVRQNNPDMFIRLFVTDDMTARIFEMTRDSGVADGGAPMTALEYDVANPGYNDSTCGGMAKQIDLQQLLLQIKRLLISSLLNGHILVLQKLAITYMLCCGHPHCRFSHTPIPAGNFVLELRLEDVPQAHHFCLRCVESVFIRQTTTQQNDGSFIPPMVALDGMTEDVLEAAQRLIPKVKDRNASPVPGLNSRKKLPERQKCALRIQDYFNPDFAFNHASNSTQALALRRRKGVEIEEILVEVEKYEKRKQDDLHSPKKLPLVITPPPQMAGEDRYKKQGLGRYDKEKERKVSEKRDTNSGVSNTTTSSTKSLKVRICHCGEPAGVGEAVKCSGEFCLIGSYHLVCTGLSEKPQRGMSWLCSNCSNDPEGTLIAAPASESGDEVQMYDSDYEYDDEMEEGYFSDESFCEMDQMLAVDPVVLGSTSEHTTTPRNTAANTFAPIGRQHIPEPPSTPTRVIDASVNAFTPVNPGRTPGRVTPFIIRRLPAFSLDGPPTIDGMGQLCLPVGWSEAIFKDLAPFIIAETNVASLRALAPEHMGMLEEWRALCPTSRLFPGQRFDLSTQGNGTYGSIVQEDVEVVPLSYLLDRADAQMAQHGRR